MNIITEREGGSGHSKCMTYTHLWNSGKDTSQGTGDRHESVEVPEEYSLLENPFR